MRTVGFYRIRAVESGGLVWIKVGNYPVPEASDDSSAVEIAADRLVRERHLGSWEDVADVCLVRMN